MKGLVTVFGGSGFVGGQIVRALAKAGQRVRVAVRQPGRGYRLRMLGDVGQIEVVQANIREPGSVARALKDAEACVNAVGVLRSAGAQTFEAVHVEAARRVAEAAAAAGAARFVQISALGAGLDRASEYARSKARGEGAVREIFPLATVLRPSVVFGVEDDFFNRFAAMAVMAPALPLIGGGHTRFQPVFVADVAAAVARAVASEAAAGQTYELGGPATYSFRELMTLMLAVIERPRALVAIPFGVAEALGAIPFAPITVDQVAMLREDNVVTAGAPGLADLGVAPSALEPIIPTYLYRYRKGGQFAEINKTSVAALAAR